MCRTYILNISHRVLFVSLLFYFHVSPLDFRARVECAPEGALAYHPNIPNTLARLSVFPLRRIFIIHFASAVSTARIMQSVGRFRESKLFLPFSLHPVPYPRLSRSSQDRRNRVKLVISNIYRISHLTPHPLASSRTVRFRETGAKVPSYPMSYIPSSSSSSSFFSYSSHIVLSYGSSEPRDSGLHRRGTLRGLTHVPPSLRPSSPSPTHGPRAHGTRRTRSGADARVRREAAVARSQHRRNRPRRSTRAPTATANAARPDPLSLPPVTLRVIVTLFFSPPCPGGGGTRDRFRGRNNSRGRTRLPGNVSSVAVVSTQGRGLKASLHAW